MNTSIVNMRLIKEKPFYMNQIEQFADYMSDKAVRVEFGKQDIRGYFSICLFSANSCVFEQKCFDSKQEMLGFIVGFNSAKSNQGYL